MQQNSSLFPAAATDTSAAARRSAYSLLLIMTIGLVGTTILTGPAVHSVNDQSRWSTIRALVETGSYAIGRRYERADRTYTDQGLVADPAWNTNDKILHPNTFRFYSSKPTLLPTVLAGEYWALHKVLGLDISENRLFVSRTILLTINWLPLLLYLLLFTRLVEQLGTTDWGRVLVVTAACCGTFVTGFSGTLNNHTVAAHGALFAMYQCLRIELDGDRRWWRFLLAGLCLGWTICNELPAAALALGMTLWLFRVSPRLTVTVAVPAMLLPVGAYLCTQYLAVGTIMPTYAHERWYRYKGSFWRHPTGIDRIREPKWIYAAHLLAGHTGILSLTPILLLGWIGMVRTVLSRQDRGTRPGVERRLAQLTSSLTALVFAFYVYRTSNYGGNAAGPRWFIWLAPLWLLTMIPEADRWERHRWQRVLASLLLLVSVGSVLYALANPWRHSWLFWLFHDAGWVRYR